MKKQKEKDLKTISEFINNEVNLECPMTNEEVMAKIDFSKPRKVKSRKSIMKVVLVNLAYIVLLCFCVLVTIMVTRKQLIDDWGEDEGKVEELFGSTIAIFPFEDNNIEVFYEESNNGMIDYYVKVIFNDKKCKISIISNNEEYEIKYNKESVKVCSINNTENNTENIETKINTIEFDVVYQGCVKHFSLQH